MSEDEYCENTWDDLGVEYVWKNVTIKDKFITDRGTLLEMIARPNWGISCYMDNAIQSCEVDERFYHEALVHPAMTIQPKTVMIIGGGEGATAREVLKWPCVTKVDMYDWDKDAIQLFKMKYPQWAKGAWNDKRLTLIHDNIFERILKKPYIVYDAIIIDLFDPCEENTVQWYMLLNSIQKWLSPHGTICIYAGIRTITTKTQPYHLLHNIIQNHFVTVGNTVINPLLLNREMITYKTYIPSFSGESTFVLIKSNDTIIDFTRVQIDTHLTNEVWNSYKTLIW